MGRLPTFTILALLAVGLALGVSHFGPKPWNRLPRVSAPARPQPLDPTPERLNPALPHFAFALGGGTTLLFPSAHPTQPEVVTRVLLPDGRSERLRIDHFQTGDGGGTGRDHAANATHLRGTLLRVLDAPLEENRSYLVASEAFLHQRHPLPVEPIAPSRRAEPLPASEKMALESLKGRRIKFSWTLARLGPRGTLHWVIFHAVKGQRALASMVLLTREGMATMDVPGCEDGSQSWRVDDDEAHAGEDFQILCACEGPEGLEWAYSWMSSESESLAYVVRRGTRLESLKESEGGRYLAPI